MRNRRFGGRCVTGERVGALGMLERTKGLDRTYVSGLVPWGLDWRAEISGRIEGVDRR